MTLINLERVLAQLRAFDEGAVEGMADGLVDEADNIMSTSQQTYVPVDTGALQSTGIVERPDVQGNHVSVTMAYGGDSVGYAVRVHEDPDARHDPPTQYKYLERPVNEAIPGMTDRIGEVVVATAKRRAGL